MNVYLWTEKQVRKLREMRQAGRTLDEIARTFGLDRNAISLACRQYGIGVVHTPKKYAHHEYEPSPEEIARACAGIRRQRQERQRGHDQADKWVDDESMSATPDPSYTDVYPWSTVRGQWKGTRP